jgi:23S rRNA (cytidine1920-2'-O)/16S rRNA (cytidine1409-2'-O)-methyltransferase
VDRLVVERGLVPTREKARRLILAGDVLVGDSPVEKPGTLVDEDASIRLRRQPKPFVGRGGEKLEGALDALGLDVSGFHVLDVGASTGGFTDCLLQRGARRVTALDVGRGQLDWKLYTDPRVRAMDDVNARHLRAEDFPEPFDLVTADVSFISLTKVIPALVPLVRSEGRLLLLVKPQFELGPEDIGKGGVVRDAKLHYRAIERVAEAAEELDLDVLDVVSSPITGATGNREFFLLLGRGGSEAESVRWPARARRACGVDPP